MTLTRKTSTARIPANDWQDLAGDVTRTARGRQKDEGRRDLFRLRGPMHRCLAAELRHAFSGLSAGLSGVQTGPGATAFTRMPRRTRCVASDRVKAWMPPLVIE